ncbi:MAG: DUF3293 domain-containing protein [Cyanobacteria bacterium J06635_13]
MNSRPKFTPEQIAALQTAYEQTIYEVYNSGQTITLSIDQEHPQLNKLMQQYHVASWAIVTAVNPYSQPLTELENRQRNQQLQTYLQRLNLSILPAVGKDCRGDWTPEPSFIILGIDRQNAIAVGQKFAQNAIVYGAINQPATLVWIETR